MKYLRAKMNGEQQQFVITGKLTIEEKKKDGRETFSAWSVKHGNSEGNSVSVKLGFALESKRKKLWPTRARAITINRFYTASPNQTQSRSFSTFLWLQMIPKNHKTGICNCWVVELHVLHAGILDDSSIVPVSWVCARDIA